MRWAVRLALANVLLVSTLAFASDPLPPWLTGIWQMIVDEDGGPVGELIEFKADGSYIFHGKNCQSHPRMYVHMHNGDAYMTSTNFPKGPIAIIFHPIENNTKLTFTSPRTTNNAVYKKTTLTRCEVQK